MKWLIIIVAAVAGLIAVVTVVGALIPKGHVASQTVTLTAPPERVFEAVSNVGAFTTWRSTLKGVEQLPDDGQGARFIEKSSDGDILYRVELLEPHTRMVTRIADPNLPFGGSWTFDLKATGAGTELTITEAGEVYNPLFRVMHRLFFSPTKTIETYVSDLTKLLAKP